MLSSFGWATGMSPLKILHHVFAAAGRGDREAQALISTTPALKRIWKAGFAFDEVAEARRRLQRIDSAHRLLQRDLKAMDTHQKDMTSADFLVALGHFTTDAKDLVIAAQALQGFLI